MKYAKRMRLPAMIGPCGSGKPARAYPITKMRQFVWLNNALPPTEFGAQRNGQRTAC